MAPSTILDIVLVIALVLYTVQGLRRGFVLSLASIVGMAAGAVLAFFAIPLVTTWVPASAFRLPAVLIVALVLIALGQWAGSLVGRFVRRGVDLTPLRAVDRILGGVITLVVTALVASMLAFGVSSLGVPVVSQLVGSSAVVQTIDRLTPDPVKALQAQVRSLVADDGLPTLFQALGSGTPLAIPDAGTGTSAQRSAAASVVKITGNAYQCGQNQSGSGFVAAADRIITNAHVVAGVDQPVVSTPAGGTFTGRVVYFNPTDDLAVIAVSGMTTATLPLGVDLGVSDTAVFDGYPLGGPFLSSPAAVQNVATIETPDIYGSNPSAREVYYLAADVQEGNSGGPLIDAAGQVTGIVFARSSTTAHLGFAMTMVNVTPLVGRSPSLTAAVSPGTCTKG